MQVQGVQVVDDAAVGGLLQGEDAGQGVLNGFQLFCRRWLVTQAIDLVVNLGQRRAGVFCRNRRLLCPLTITATYRDLAEG